jgi:hypothetical protein
MTPTQQLASIGIALTATGTRQSNRNIDRQNIGNRPLLNELSGRSIKMVADQPRDQILRHANLSIPTPIRARNNSHRATFC